MTPAELAAGNLLSSPSTQFVPAALYHLVFSKSIGPLDDETTLEWLTTADFYPLGAELVRQGNAIGVTVKAKAAPASRNIDQAFAEKRDGAPGFAQADLELRYVAKGTRPDELANLVLAVANSGDADPWWEKFLKELGADAKAVGKWLLIALLLVLGIVFFAKVYKGRE